KVRLYVENITGYRNLCRMLSDQTRGDLFSGDQSLDGLIAVGPQPKFAALFPNRFYLAITHPDQLDGHRGGLPKVFSSPVHHASRDDRWKFDVVQSIRTQTLLKQTHALKQLDGIFHFPALKKLQEAFARNPEVLAHSLEIADRCHFQFECGRPQFPTFIPPDGSAPTVFLRELVMRGLRERYPRQFDSMQKQISEELSIISEVGYEEYFLVMWNILQQCRKQGIDWITRGSAADSLVCYCLRISDVCPIRFDLYFRRFLNKERMAMNKLPDIDVDFPHDRKDEVVDLIFAQYGREHVAVVGGFSTYQARSALGDVAKVLGISEYQIRRVTERLPYHLSPTAIGAAMEQNREGQDLPLNEEPYKSALQMAQFLDGFPRHPKMHPCGVVIARQPIHEIVPTFISNKSYPTTHFDMESVESVGLVKMDILAQGGLAVMRDTQALLRDRGIEVDLSALEPNDPEVWEMISLGGARGVHHIESPAMLSLCKMCHVQDIDTLIGIVSVIRPGAANQNSKAEFTRRYQRLAPVVYPHPSLEPCLKCSFGLVIYEEQILQICEAFAGLPPGRADVLRRALGKEKEPLIAEIRAEFFACARVRQREETKIDEVWKLVDGFRGYAFCKAHSTAYGVEAYQSAWLKRYYPAETMAAILTNGKGFYHPLVYVLESHRLGVATLPPSINEARPGFCLVDGKIRVPISSIKGVSTQLVARQFQERKSGRFQSLRDFFQRVRPGLEEMELLIRIGAFDEFDLSRTQQFWEFRLLAESCREHSSAQGWLLPPMEKSRLPEIALEEPTAKQRLEAEVAAFGFCVSRHPLDFYDDIAWETYCPVKEMRRYIGQEITTCGLIIEDRVYNQANGEPMKFLSIADYTGITETELFAKTYRSHGLATVRYPVLEITGKVEPYENGRGFSLRVMHAGKPRLKNKDLKSGEKMLT
ncbi:MAG: DNA polymerase III subunit alpha, partial [Verrucomicrobiota bacterium]